MLKKIFIKFINIYQNYIRTILPSSCRFYPSCSEYTKQAIIKYGWFKGIFKGIRRLMFCNPFSQKTGFDPSI